MRPQIVGAALNQISDDPEIEAALFEILENQRLLEGEARITLVPRGSDLLAQMLAASAKAQRPETPADVSRRAGSRTGQECSLPKQPSDPRNPRLV